MVEDKRKAQKTIAPSFHLVRAGHEEHALRKQLAQGKPFRKPRKGPKCTRCLSFLVKKSVNGRKAYFCQHHGFVRYVYSMVSVLSSGSAGSRNQED